MQIQDSPSSRTATPGEGPIAPSTVRRVDNDDWVTVSPNRKERLDIDLETPCFRVRDFTLYYGTDKAIDRFSLTIPSKRVTAFIGPSGCGKSTLLRSLNRMNDLIDTCRVEGDINLDGESLYDPNLDVSDLRRRVGMVFQKPNPFPKSIFENVAYGLRIQGVRDRRRLAETVEGSLKRAALWDEVKDRLKTPANSLSGGQQQRLVIARAIAIEPEVLLLDEPASALDPVSTGRIEELIQELKRDYTIVIVTHNMQQAARVSDYTAFMYLGRLVEFADTTSIFNAPVNQQTRDYVMGRFG